MANEILPPNSSFNRALAQVQAKRRAESTEETEAPRSRTSPRARLNFIPGSEMLDEMIDRARLAMSRGMIWARGAILNLLV